MSHTLAERVSVIGVFLGAGEAIRLDPFLSTQIRPTRDNTSITDRVPVRRWGRVGRIRLRLGAHNGLVVHRWQPRREGIESSSGPPIIPRDQVEAEGRAG